MSTLAIIIDEDLISLSRRRDRRDEIVIQVVIVLAAVKH